MNDAGFTLGGDQTFRFKLKRGSKSGKWNQTKGQFEGLMWTVGWLHCGKAVVTSLTSKADILSRRCCLPNYLIRFVVIFSFFL